MNTTRTALLAAAAMFVAAPLALAQTSTPGTASTRSMPATTGTTTLPSTAMTTTAGTAANAGSMQLSNNDKQYLMRDARGEAYELQISQLAQQKATSPAVKQYASEVVQDHQQTMQTLQQVAQSAGVRTLPTAPRVADQRKATSLQKLSGAAFDRAYTSDIKAANTQDVSDERAEANRTKSDAFKQVLAQFAQVDQKHLQGAQSLQASNTAISGKSKS